MKHGKNRPGGYIVLRRVGHVPAAAVRISGISITAHPLAMMSSGSSEPGNGLLASGLKVQAFQYLFIPLVPPAALFQAPVYRFAECFPAQCQAVQRADGLNARVAAIAFWNRSDCIPEILRGLCGLISTRFQLLTLSVKSRTG